jgi:hypothetical protein
VQSAGVSLTSPGDPNRGLGVKQVLIRSIDSEGGIVYATDAGGAEVQLPWRIRRVGITPAAGQTWIADRQLGFWSLAAYVCSDDGLWTPPDGCYGSVQEQSAAVTQPLTTTDWPFPLANPTFANPSPVWQMRVAAWAHARMTVDLPAASGGYLKNLVQFANHSTGARNAAAPVGNPTAVAVSGQWVSSWNHDETVIDPGQAVTLTATVSAGSFSPSVAPTLTSWLLRVHFLAWLIDPAQPAGVA